MSSRSLVTVYQYIVLDTDVVEPRIANRWGTRDAINRLKHADLIEDSVIRIDESILNVGGFTPSNFDPSR